MRIVVASGKGGTGKTTVATSLALVAAERNAVRFRDCDVEAPNAALFLHPALDTQQRGRHPRPAGGRARLHLLRQVRAKSANSTPSPSSARRCSSSPNSVTAAAVARWICPEQAISERLAVMGVIDSGRRRRASRLPRA